MILALTSVLISCCSLIISAITFWFTLLRKGNLKMTRPTFIAFGFDDANKKEPKIFLRTLLYSTARRPQIIENMFIKLHREKSFQTFNIWAYGNKELYRGSGICIPFEGFTYNHHFLLPKDQDKFEYFPGEYRMEVYASFESKKKSRLLYKAKMNITTQQAFELKQGNAFLYNDWDPNLQNYHSYIVKSPIKIDSYGLGLPFLKG